MTKKIKIIRTQFWKCENGLNFLWRNALGLLLFRETFNSSSRTDEIFANIYFTEKAVIILIKGKVDYRHFSFHSYESSETDWFVWNCIVFSYYLWHDTCSKRHSFSLKYSLAISFCFRIPCGDLTEPAASTFAACRTERVSTK